MKRIRFAVPVGLVAAAVLGGIGINAVLAQMVPQCQPPVAGCAALPCTIAAGACPVTGVPFFAIIRTPVAYVPCGPGVLNNCPNPLLPRASCIEDDFTGTFVTPCQNNVCVQTLISFGC